MIKKVVSASYYKNGKHKILLECGHIAYGQFVGQTQHDCWKCDEIKKGTIRREI